MYFSFSGSPTFIEGWCPGSKAPVFNQANSFATVPIIYLNDRSFTISCWIKQTKSVGDQIGAIYSDWYNPWHFTFQITNQRIGKQRIQFTRHSQSGVIWWNLVSTVLSLSVWTHVAVTWNQVTRTVLIYADGRVSHNNYSLGKPFYTSTGRPYQIGNDGHWENHQFYGSVMDLYVFGTALSLDEIDKLRGER